MFLLAGPLCAGATCQDKPDPVIQTIKVTDSIYMLQGNGGNIGLCVGKDGAFLIDDQFAPMVGQIKAAVRKVSEKPVKFLLNTHHHGDHTGGNERFGETGAIIVAHENVRKRMSQEQFNKDFGRSTPPAKVSALPVVTFAEGLTFHWNDEEIEVFHVEHAHTDGDAIIHFKKAKVLHMGDTFFNGSYPYIDLGSGGSFDGLIAAVDKVLQMTDDKYQIIPGHGPLAKRKDLQAYRDMLHTVRSRIFELVMLSKNEAEILAAKPTKDLDETWGKGFMKPEVWTKIVIKSIKDEGKKSLSDPVDMRLKLGTEKKIK